MTTPVLLVHGNASHPTEHTNSCVSLGLRSYSLRGHISHWTAARAAVQNTCIHTYICIYSTYIKIGHVLKYFPSWAISISQGCNSGDKAWVFCFFLNFYIHYFTLSCFYHTIWLIKCCSLSPEREKYLHVLWLWFRFNA